MVQSSKVSVSDSLAVWYLQVMASTVSVCLPNSPQLRISILQQSRLLLQYFIFILLLVLYWCFYLPIHILHHINRAVIVITFIAIFAQQVDAMIVAILLSVDCTCIGFSDLKLMLSWRDLNVYDCTVHCQLGDWQIHLLCCMSERLIGHDIHVPSSLVFCCSGLTRKGGLLNYLVITWNYLWCSLFKIFHLQLLSFTTSKLYPSQVLIKLTTMARPLMWPWSLFKPLLPSYLHRCMALIYLSD